jgi:hypothetical protein
MTLQELHDAIGDYLTNAPEAKNDRVLLADNAEPRLEVHVIEFDMVDDEPVFLLSTDPEA